MTPKYVSHYNTKMFENIRLPSSFNRGPKHWRPHNSSKLRLVHTLALRPSRRPPGTLATHLCIPSPGTMESQEPQCTIGASWSTHSPPRTMLKKTPMVSPPPPNLFFSSNGFANMHQVCTLALLMLSNSTPLVHLLINPNPPPPTPIWQLSPTIPHICNFSIVKFKTGNSVLVATLSNNNPCL